MRLAIVALFLINTYSSGAAELKTISRFDEIPNPDQTGTLVALDLDETVMKPVGFIGSEKWYADLAADLGSNHARAMRIWNRLQSDLLVKPLDAFVAEWIRGRQAFGSPVIGLTARRPEISRATLKQVKALGIDFSRVADLKSGVLFAGEKTPKGHVLSRFLRKHAVRRVIFVDDKDWNLYSVLNALRGDGVEVEVYRFQDPSCERLL